MNRKAVKRPIKIAVTGHREFDNSRSRLEWKETFLDSVARFVETLNYAGVTNDRMIFLSGCALGVDIWFANYAYNKEISYELYLPFKRTVQVVKSRFSPRQIKLLNTLIVGADKVVVVNKKFYPYGYQQRNIWLVNASDILLTYYQRKRSGSGNCERYARTKKHWIVDLMAFDGLSDLPFCMDELL
jgi:uncharacterized phage-like protein YoqJ